MVGLVFWSYREVKSRLRARKVSMGGTVPLSEHEERLLDQIERALEAEDPKFAHAVRSSDPRVHYKRRVVKAGLGFLLGVALLLAGVVSKYIWIGVAGFLVMLATAMWALTSWRRISGSSAARAPSPPPARPRRRRRGRATGNNFMERLEERWRRRQEGDM
jgi:Protein of unknown function (DUF3040)